MVPTLGGRHSESACYLRPTSLTYENTTSLPSNVTASWDDAGRKRNTNTPNGATAGVPGFNEYGYDRLSKSHGNGTTREQLYLTQGAGEESG